MLWMYVVVLIWAVFFPTQTLFGKRCYKSKTIFQLCHSIKHTGLYIVFTSALLLLRHDLWETTNSPLDHNMNWLKWVRVRWVKHNATLLEINHNNPSWRSSYLWTCVSFHYFGTSHCRDINRRQFGRIYSSLKVSSNEMPCNKYNKLI